MRCDRGRLAAGQGATAKVHANVNNINAFAQLILAHVARNARITGDLQIGGSAVAIAITLLVRSALDPAAAALMGSMTTEPTKLRKGLIDGPGPARDWRLDQAGRLVGHGGPRQPGGAAQLEGIDSRPTDRGNQSAGAGSYLDTNYLPSAHSINYTLNAACFGLWSRTGDSSTNWDIGGASGAQLIRMRCRSGSNTSLRINSSTADESFANSDGAGCSSPTAPAPAPPSATATARASAGGAGHSWSIRQQALAFFGGSLTADQIAALYEAFAYYLDAIGAI